IGVRGRPRGNDDNELEARDACLSRDSSRRPPSSGCPRVDRRLRVEKPPKRSPPRPRLIRGRDRARRAHGALEVSMLSRIRRVAAMTWLPIAVFGFDATMVG